ncbi:MBL fold metallo-hydrolase [Deltaproteobacteria bacterium]|nr:MBL fold metallo-hydrolase [Deltaproteobacteria bacterium]
MRVTAIEGNRQKLDGGAMYGNAPRALWSRWSAPDAENRIELACRAMLVETDDGRRVLCEAGIGTFFAPELRARFGVEEPRHVLLDSLAAHGLRHDEIDVVVLSHLHFDHAGGCLSSFEAGAQLLFPNARFVVGAAAWARANAPHPRDRASFIPDLNRQLAATGRMEVLDSPRSATLGDGWRFHLSDGHTPGLLLAEVDIEGEPLVFAADAIPGVPWVHVPITMGYDRFPERLIDEKEQLLAGLLARGGSLFFTHDPLFSHGRVTRDAKGRYGVADAV